MHNDRALVRSKRPRPAKSTMTLQRGSFESPRPLKRVKVTRTTQTTYSSLLMASSKESPKRESVSPASVASVQLFTPPASPGDSDSLTSSQSSSPSITSLESSSKRVSFRLGIDGVSVLTCEEVATCLSSPSQTTSDFTPKSILKPGRPSFPEVEASTSPETLRSQFKQAVASLDTSSVGTRLRAYTDINEIFKTYNVLLEWSTLSIALQNLYLACSQDLLRREVDLSVLNESRCKTQLLKCVFTLLWVDEFRRMMPANFDLEVLKHCDGLLVHPQSPKQLLSQVLHVLSSVDVGASRLPARDAGILLRHLRAIPSRYMGKNIEYQRLAVYERLLDSCPAAMAANLVEWREAFFQGLMSMQFPLVIYAVQVGFKILKILGNNAKFMSNIADSMIGDEDDINFIYNSRTGYLYQRCDTWLESPGKGPIVPRLWTVITLLHAARASTKLKTIMPAKRLKPLLECMVSGPHNQKTRAAAKRVWLVFCNTYNNALVGNIDFANTFMDVVTGLPPQWILANMSEVLKIMEFVVPWRLASLPGNVDDYICRFEALWTRFSQAVESALSAQPSRPMIDYGHSIFAAYLQQQEEFVATTESATCPLVKASLRKIMHESRSPFKDSLPSEEFRVVNMESQLPPTVPEPARNVPLDTISDEDNETTKTGEKRNREEFESDNGDTLGNITSDENNEDTEEDIPPAKRCKFEALATNYTEGEMDLDASISTASASSPRSMLGRFRKWAYGLGDSISSIWKMTRDE